MVNNSTISSKAKNLLSPQLIEYNKKTTTYDIGNPSPDLGQMRTKSYNMSAKGDLYAVN